MKAMRQIIRMVFTVAICASVNQPSSLSASAPIITLGSWDGHQYFYDTGSYSSYSDANLSAQAWGAQLASITSQQENDFLIAAITPFASLQLRAAWIGLIRPSIADPFTWVSGEPLAYSNWRPAGTAETFAEPTNFPGETRGVMYIKPTLGPVGFSRLGEWADDFPNSGEPFNAIYEVVPEPSTFSLVLISAGCFLMRRRLQGIGAD